MALPTWINFIFSGASLLITIMLIDMYFYMRKKRTVICMIPELVKRKVLIPLIGSSMLIAAGFLYFVYNLTQIEVFRDLMTISFDFFLLTMIHFTYSLRNNLLMVTE